jgi:hypothetical protein
MRMVIKGREGPGDTYRREGFEDVDAQFSGAHFERALGVYLGAKPPTKRREYLVGEPGGDTKAFVVEIKPVIREM